MHEHFIVLMIQYTHNGTQNYSSRSFRSESSDFLFAVVMTTLNQMKVFAKSNCHIAEKLKQNFNFMHFHRARFQTFMRTVFDMNYLEMMMKCTQILYDDENHCTKPEMYIVFDCKIVDHKKGPKISRIQFVVCKASSLLNWSKVSTVWTVSTTF